MWLHVFVIWTWYFWCVVKLCLIFTRQVFYAATQGLPYFLVREFGSFLSVSVSRFSSAFQPFFFYFFKHESYHFLIVIILVQVFVFYFTIYVCTQLNRCQVSKCFTSSKKCIVNVTSCFSYFSLGDFDTSWKVHAIISCDDIFKITSNTVNFSLVQIMI